jgi:hypothetical protein
MWLVLFEMVTQTVLLVLNDDDERTGTTTLPRHNLPSTITTPARRGGGGGGRCRCIERAAILALGVAAVAIQRVPQI